VLRDDRAQTDLPKSWLIFQTASVIQKTAESNTDQSMANIPSDLKYAKSHEWVRVAAEVATVGITDHAQHELTDIVFVELPAVGKNLRAGEACAVVESVKTASDIYSPISGAVVEVNPAVVENPALVNTEPYGGGWFFKVRLSAPTELNSLLSPEQYAAQIGGG
jgi:glycine cleavage system H protein